MANEFIARKGLIVLENGIKITGSAVFLGDITSSGNIKAPEFTGSFKGDGSQLTGLVTSLRISGSTGTDTVSLLTDDLNVLGSNGVTTVITDNTVTIGIPLGSVSASIQVDHDATTNFVADEHIAHSTVSINAGSGLVGGGNITTSRTLALDTGSATFLDGVKTKLNTETVFSSSIQTDVRNTTGIATIATTGSNTFTGIQTISNTTNSTTYSDGALIVAGGVGIARDVNISGSLRVTGLLTAASMSTQYVTSSQYNIGVSKIVLNDDDNIRFAGISVFDSGSTSVTASIFWDSENHKFIYQNEGITGYTGGILIAGPRNIGALGEEQVLISGRVPVSTGGDHIDTSPASSSIYIDFSNKKTHVEAGLYVTGSVSSSVGFFGDGSNLTGIVTTLSLTGSQGGQGEVSLKTQGLTITGTNGIATTVSGQTLTIANPYFVTASLYTAVGPTTNEVVCSLPTGSYDAGHFDYIIKDGTNYRTGTVMAVWNNSSVEFTDTSTNDIGNTSGATFSVDTNTANVRLKFTVSSGTWTIKTATRLF